MTLKLAKNADILLISCPFWDLRWPPHGILHVHEALKAAGFDSVFQDINLFLHNNPHLHLGPGPTPQEVAEFHALWNAGSFGKWTQPDFVGSFSKIIDRIATGVIAAQPRTVGFTLSSNNKLFSLELAKRLKKLRPALPIIFGGYECFFPDILPYYSDVPDYYVTGEAEEIAPELLTALLRGSSEERTYSIPGVMINDPKGHSSYKPAIPPQNMDEIRYPRYEDVSLEDYTVKGGKYVWVEASRGCNWGRCAFCTHPGEFRVRSPEHVMEEMRYLYHDHGVRRFSFSDQDVNNSPDTFMRLCRLIINEGMGKRISLYGQLRVSKQSDRLFFRTLRQAGFWLVDIGLESGSNRVLRLMKKGISKELAERNIRAAKREGLLVGVNIIVGFPGETYEDFVDTLKWLITMRPFLDRLGNVAGAILMRASYMFEHSEKYGIESPLLDSDDTSLRTQDATYDWRSKADPGNTPANRSLRVQIVRRLVVPFGIDTGNPFAATGQLDIGAMAAPEQELWRFVEKELGQRLDPRHPSSVNTNLLTRTYHYYRRSGLISTLMTTLRFLPMILRGRVWV
ncbi:B12-binding domain-containing radical SAM protein [Thermodesulfobacteriota bacterium]